MKNITGFWIKLSFLILLAFTFWGCNLPKEEIYPIDDENKGWLFSGDVGSNFIMADNNGISESFTMFSNLHDFDEGASGYFFITTSVSKRESFHQGFSSTYGHTLSLSLSASYPPFGDELYVNLNGLSFAYDLKYQTISRLYTPFGDKSKIMTDKGYSGYIIIESSVEFFDNFVLNDITYPKVLHFKFDDYPESWTDFTVRELFIGWEAGLVKYVLNNGLEYTRHHNQTVN